ncbi:uncharacterized protein LOC123266143 [Cotesia glomerata]|uniref:uncharacterized protein LOC123266143 n=1 Tax=Cotesia glomerata TaxID=32391 RepID=UPI001D02BFB8|nr:uncharacterized protein LOC123266143 [Cotesia glomerata]
MGKGKKRSRDRSRERDGGDNDKRIRRLEMMVQTLVDAVIKDKESVNLPETRPEETLTEHEGESAENLVLQETPKNDLPETVVKEKENLEVQDLLPEAKKLDDEIEIILGDDPGAEKKNQVDLHESLVSRWTSWLTEGLPKEMKEKLIEEYPRKGNVCLEAPELNQEIVSSLNETGVKRDQYFVLEQKLAGSALSALGQGITMILKDAEEPLDRLELLKKLADAGKLMSQLHFQVSSARKSFISPTLTKPMKNLLQSTKPGLLLYGENLTEKIKAAKSIEKIGKEIKNAPPTSAPPQNRKTDRPVPAQPKTVSAKKSPDNLSKQQGRVRQCIQGGQQDPEIKLCGQEEVDNQVRLVAGRLSHFLHEWRQVTNDNFILNCVKGYEIPFHTKPPRSLSFIKELQFPVEEEAFIGKEIEKLLQMGAIKKVKAAEDQFLSPFFLVPKPDGSKRFILNLKCLNQFILTHHFKIEDLRVALKLIYPDYFLCNLDLKDAYFLVKIGPNTRSYLRFSFKGQVYEFQCMPFGLCTSPYVFTKLLKPALNILRERGWISTAYLDDILCIGRSMTECRNNVTCTRKILSKLGFIVNERKSMQIPERSCKYLGFVIDSKNMTLSLPEEKKLKLRKMIKEFLNKDSCSIREMAGLIGVLVAACPGIPYGMLYTKLLEREKLKALIINEQDFNKKMLIQACVKKELCWWLSKIVGAKNQIRTLSYRLEIFSDASLTGWGAHCNGENAHGFWTQAERKLHINHLEIIAAFLALKCFAKDYKNCEILLRIDNTTAISYINRMGGVQYVELNKRARDIWTWCEERKIWIFASYIPSRENTEADRESRRANVDTEWELEDQSFQKIVNKWGTPLIDLFASRNNTKAKWFCSWKRDPEALYIDAFTVNEASTSENSFPGGREALRRSYRQKLIPEEAVEILIASLTESTIKQYTSALKNWWSFCESTNQDPLQPDIYIVLKYLTFRFNQNASYGTLNSERSAINLLSVVDLGNDPLIGRFFKGVFKNRPPRPKYNEIWNTETLLNWAEALEPLHTLDQKSLTYKLVCLLALATAHRVQTLSLIKISDIIISKNNVVIKIREQIKTSRIGSLQPSFTLPFFNERKSACVATTLLSYLEKTKDLRKGEDHLFITFKKPFHRATSQSISRWIKTCLLSAGIDPRYTAHSTRHASTSAGEARGLDVNIIKSTAGWSVNSQVFAKFYKRPIEPRKESFAETILLNKKVQK